MPESNFGEKKLFLQNFISFHPFESINFQPAGLLKIALIVTPYYYEFTSFKIRIRMITNNEAQIPRIKDLRIIADI